MSTKNDPENTESAGDASADETPKQAALPRDFEQKSKERFAKLAKPEIAFEQYLENEKNEFQRRTALAANPALKYQPTPGKITPCGNGDFEKMLDPAEWQGAYANNLLPLPATNPFAGFTAGLLAGSIGNSASHQTWVAAGTDPNVPIPTTAPGLRGSGKNWECGCRMWLRAVVQDFRGYACGADYYVLVCACPEQPRGPLT